MHQVASIHDLMTAIDEHDASTVRGLLDEFPHLLEATDRCECTPLMRAAISGRRSLEVISTILEAGADVNAQSPKGYTALHCAIDVNETASRNAEQVIARLVAAGANLALRQNYGWTPLLCAVLRGKAREARCLLALGAEANETLPLDSVPAFTAGRTALMAALTSSACEEIVHALVQAGADPFTLDHHGMDFFAYAEILRHEWGEWRFSGAVDRGEAIMREWLDADPRATKRRRSQRALSRA